MDCGFTDEQERLRIATIECAGAELATDLVDLGSTGTSDIQRRVIARSLGL